MMVILPPVVTTLNGSSPIFAWAITASSPEYEKLRKVDRTHGRGTSHLPVIAQASQSF
jgi:hypothetical protein